MILPSVKVVCAIVKKDDSYLIAQRSEFMSNPLKWEFPGGKVAKEEGLKEAIVRECKEELNVGVKALKIYSSVQHSYAHLNIELFPVLCDIVHGKITLTEHVQYAFLSKDNLLKYDLSEADKLIIDLL